MSSKEGQRKPKTPEGGCPEREAVNSPKAKGAPSLSAVREAESPHETTYLLMEEVVERENMKQALKRVEQNRGVAGADGMEVGALRLYLRKNWAELG